MLTKKEPDLFQRLERETSKKHILFIASIEVTHRCNANCEFCIMKPLINKPSKNKEMTLKEYESLSKDLREIGTYHIQISGGEPLIRKDIKEIIEVFRNDFFAVTLNTNGFLLTDQFIYFLSKIGLLQVIVSFHTLRHALFKEIWGVPYNLDEQIKNIIKLKEAGINVLVNVVVERRNIEEFFEIKNFWEDKEIKVLWDLVEPQVYPQIVPLKSITPTKAQLKKFYFHLEEIPKSNNGSLICSAGRNHLTFSPFGDIYPCGRLRIPIGKYPNDDIKSLWRNSTLLQQLRNLRNEDLRYCTNCQYKEFCAFCIGNNYNTNSDIIKPVKEICNRAKIAKEVYYVRDRETHN